MSTVPDRFGKYTQSTRCVKQSIAGVTGLVLDWAGSLIDMGQTTSRLTLGEVETGKEYRFLKQNKVFINMGHFMS